ncbi:MAG: hypothetical protein ACOVP4_13955 [Bacteriovoracaceae bacterium]|jgi:hypothetical protein
MKKMLVIGLLVSSTAFAQISSNAIQVSKGKSLKESVKNAKDICLEFGKDRARALNIPLKDYSIDIISVTSSPSGQDKTVTVKYVCEAINFYF